MDARIRLGAFEPYCSRMTYRERPSMNACVRLRSFRYAGILVTIGHSLRIIRRGYAIGNSDGVRTSVFLLPSEFAADLFAGDRPQVTRMMYSLTKHEVGIRRGFIRLG